MSGSDKKKKKSPKQHTDEAGKKDRGDSAHANQRIGLFTAEEMKACIDEIKEVEQRAKDEGKKPEFSRNEICEKHGISPSSVSKRMTGKVKGYRPQLGGARRGKILSQGMFKLSGYHADTPITINAEASRKADSRIH